MDVITAEKAVSNNKDVATVDIRQSSVNFFQLMVYVFVLSCIIGFIVEVIYAYVTEGAFVNKQGMIYGPFNQVYGFGGVLFVGCLYRFRNSKKYIIFIAAAVLGGAFEYLCSFVQEIVFKSESWNYNHLPLSLDGRTNPIHASFWGILAVFFFTFCLPPLVIGMGKIPRRVNLFLSWFLFVFMLFNMIISAAAVIRQTERMAGDKADNAVEVFLDEHYNDELLKKVYPNMKFID